MKKNLFFATILLCSISCFADQYEYANDKYCIYKINVGEQTASVVNFYSEASVVTIPASFVYQGDRYIVTALGYKDLGTSIQEDFFGNTYLESYGKYSYEDYKKNRASIVELKLPSTLKTISWNAFKDMTRLKSITIPKGVKEFKESYFSDNSRLETITIEGLPCCEFSDSAWKDHKICLSEVNDPTPFLDSMKLEMKRYDCPKLQKIEVLPLKYLITYAKKLNDTVSVYKAKLQSHPYYVEKDYFSDIKIHGSNDAEFKKDYNKQIALCRAEFTTLWNNMEQTCKEKYPDTYADYYCAYHPEFSAQIDSLLKDYKCDYTKQRLAVAMLKNIRLGEKCQDKLWKQYAYLYKNKEHFLATYYKSSDINQDIAMRDSICNNLKKTIKIISNAYGMSIKGIYIYQGYGYGYFNEFFSLYNAKRKLNIPITVNIISLDSKAIKEYNKNGKFFKDADEFCDAYVTSYYKNVLKEKKKAKK